MIEKRMGKKERKRKGKGKRKRKEKTKNKLIYYCPTCEGRPVERARSHRNREGWSIVGQTPVEADALKRKPESMVWVFRDSVSNAIDAQSPTCSSYCLSLCAPLYLPTSRAKLIIRSICYRGVWCVGVVTRCVAVSCVVLCGVLWCDVGLARCVAVSCVVLCGVVLCCVVRRYMLFQVQSLAQLGHPLIYKGILSMHSVTSIA